MSNEEMIKIRTREIVECTGIVEEGGDSFAIRLGKMYRNFRADGENHYAEICLVLSAFATKYGV